MKIFSFAALAGALVVSAGRPQRTSLSQKAPLVQNIFQKSFDEIQSQPESVKTIFNDHVMTSFENQDSYVNQLFIKCGSVPASLQRNIKQLKAALAKEASESDQTTRIRGFIQRKLNQCANAKSIFEDKKFLVNVGLEQLELRTTALLTGYHEQAKNNAEFQAKKANVGAKITAWKEEGANLVNEYKSHLTPEQIAQLESVYNDNLEVLEEQLEVLKEQFWTEVGKQPQAVQEGVTWLFNYLQKVKEYREEKIEHIV